MATFKEVSTPGVDQLVEELDLTCGMCSKVYTEPKILTCLHIYCKRCIQKHIVSLQPGTKFTCPKCGSEIPLTCEDDANTLPTAFYIKRRMKLYELLRQAEAGEVIQCGACTRAKSTDPAQSYCRHCSCFLCANCMNSHKYMTAFKEHLVVTIAELRENTEKNLPIRILPYCEEHSTGDNADSIKNLDYYCSTCHKPVCKQCLHLNHRNHTCSALIKHANNCKVSLETNLTVMHDYRSKLTTAAKEVQEVKEKLVRKNDVAAIEIHDAIDKAIRGLTERKQQLLQDIEYITEHKLNALNKQLESLKKSATNMGDVEKFIQSVLGDGTDATITFYHGCITTKCQDEVLTFQKQDLTPVTMEDMEVHLSSENTIGEFLCESMSVSHRSVDPKACEVRGVGTHTAEINTRATIEIHVRYPNGMYCIEEKIVTVELQSVVDHEKTVDGQVDHREKGIYTASYLPTVRGRHELHVRVNNCSIEGSPFKVYVAYPPAELINSCQALSRIEEIERPYGMLRDHDGKIVVAEVPRADKKESSVIYLSKNRNSIDKRIVLESENIHPSGIAEDSELHVFYVADCGENRIIKYNSNWERIATSDKLSINRPGRITVGRDGHLYVCERGNHQIQVLNKDLKQISTVDLKAERPVHIIFDENGCSYVSDHNGGQILRFDHLGQKVKTIGPLASPRGMCIHNSYLYVAERDSHKISIFKTNGESVGDFADKHVGFLNPSSVIADEDGFLYVCDEELNCVFVF